MSLRKTERGSTRSLSVENSLWKRLFWAFTQRVVVTSDVSTQTFGPIAKELGRVSYPETSVRNYHYTLRDSSEERSFPLLRGDSLKSRRPWTCRKTDYRMGE